MYRIVFVDERKDDIDSFKDYVEGLDTEKKFTVVSLLPLPELTDTVNEVLKAGADALVTDFMLNEYKESINYNVPYNGVELVQHFTSIRDGFPSFVITSFDDDAIQASEDVNIVYIKDILHRSEKQTNAKASFLERIESQIEHYKTRIQKAETRLMELVEQRKAGNTNLEQENELIQLDHFLETSIDKHNAIPQDFKNFTNTDKLEKILLSVDELIKTLKDGK